MEPREAARSAAARGASARSGSLQIPGLESWGRLRHGLSLRPWNVSYTAGEEYGSPAYGRAQLCESVGIDPAKTVVAGQVHGRRVAWIGPEHAHRHALQRGTALPETDGLATATPGVGCLITAADCPPVILWDSKTPALAVLHCGWRGTAAEIVREGVRMLVAHAGTHPRDLFAAIGPGIGPCCYEVGPEVLERVPREWQRSVIAMPARACEGKPKLHLGAWLTLQLASEGIAPERIMKSPWCTGCRTDLFYSHRIERGRCGRFGLLAAIAE